MSRIVLIYVALDVMVRKLDGSIRICVDYRALNDDSIVATAFQALTSNRASCLLEMLVIGFGLCNGPATFPDLRIMCRNHILTNLLLYT